MPVTLTTAEEYYKRGRDPAHKVIEGILKQDEDLILHGSRALNAQLPGYLEVITEDWDIFASDNPRAEALAIERKLDDRYGGNFFHVVPGKHRGTFKVKSRVTNRTIADVTLQEGDIPHKKILGINMATLDYHVEKIQETLGDPESKYRWDKDRETLQRIKIHKKKAKSKRR